MSRLRIRQSQPNLAKVGVGAELGNKFNVVFGHILSMDSPTRQDEM